MKLNGIKINGFIISAVMKEAIRRMIVTINKHKISFETESKIGYSGLNDDFRTTGDKESDRIAIKYLQKCFPEFGIISEETGIIKCTHPFLKIYFTIDSLDGTFAYIRRQSNGFGPMISLVCNGEIIAVYIGDAMTSEIYGFHPDSGSVHRISDFEHGESLRNSHQKKLAGSWIMSRENPFDLSELSKKMFGQERNNRLFGGINVEGGSIGLTMAKLWKGEVSAIILKSHFFTPWDICPILGISEKLNYVFLKIDDENKKIIPIKIQPPLEKFSLKAEIIIIHRSNLPELNDWVIKNIN